LLRRKDTILYKLLIVVNLMQDEKKIMSYTIPAQTHIGHVHLKVTDLEKALAFL